MTSSTFILPAPTGKAQSLTCSTAILQTAGYKVGLFTSPHLIDFRERIRVNGEMIPEADAVVLLRNMKINGDIRRSLS